jgi:hypothetical protein
MLSFERLALDTLHADVGMIWNKRDNTMAIIRHPPDAGLAKAKIATFDGYRQCQTLDMGLSCTQVSDIGAPSAENADFVVIQTYLSHGF